MDKKSFDPIPLKERKKIKIKEIRALAKIGYSMDQICLKTNSSKTTVFFALHPTIKRKSNPKN